MADARSIGKEDGVTMLIEVKGKLFDPAFHEVVMWEETDGHPENSVINELQKVYMIHDWLLRPARVADAQVKDRPATTTFESKVFDYKLSLWFGLFTDTFYKEVCTARLSPVLETIQLMKELGGWVEVATLIIPGLNDGEEELRDAARFVKSVGPELPWHVSRFYPAYKFLDRPRAMCCDGNPRLEIAYSGTPRLRHIAFI